MSRKSARQERRDSLDIGFINLTAAQFPGGKLSRLRRTIQLSATIFSA
jgi:hypothetical protein